MFKKLTPVLVVESIEPVLPLWEALGFQRTIEVPHGDALGFVGLQGGATEVMYQTVASVKADEGKILEGKVALGAAAIFFEVEDLDAVMAKLPANTDIVTSRRKTFYGSTETIVRDAAGNVVTFAQFG
jgi:uncharacterized glyoxalase superfamily protein PhnB